MLVWPYLFILCGVVALGVMCRALTGRRLSRSFISLAGGIVIIGVTAEQWFAWPEQRLTTLMIAAFGVAALVEGAWMLRKERVRS